ncbi:MAG: hypothetical protein WB699_08300, partial [Bacteroidota bacterium]
PGGYALTRGILSSAGVSSPCTYFNGMIAPIIPFPLRGVLWDQSESRVGWPGEYAEVLLTLIEDWRAHWESESLAFYLVQSGNHGTGHTTPESMPYIREAQENALHLPHTGMAVTLDMGGPENPRNESEIGRRLALLARHRVYGDNCEDTGPIFRSMMVPAGSVVVRFDHDDGGLMSLSGSMVQGFSVAGKDRVFYPAKASVLSGSVVVFCPGVPHPVAVRYGWDPTVRCTLYNREFLPAVPFRTDRWEDARMALAHESARKAGSDKMHRTGEKKRKSE